MDRRILVPGPRGAFAHQGATPPKGRPRPPSPPPSRLDRAKGPGIVPQAGPLAGESLYTNSYAVVIGIDKYRHLGPTQQLRYARKDAEDIRAMLVKSFGFPESNIVLLRDGDATKKAIEKALDRLSRAKPSDRVLVYFSGHGMTVKASGGEIGVLVPHDADVNLSDTSDGVVPECLLMDVVWTYLRKVPARHRLLLADACFSGLLARDRALEPYSPETLRRMAGLPALQAITASGRSEVSKESDAVGNGIFTRKLLDVLGEVAKAPGQVVTAREIADRVARGVSSATKGRQTPQYGVHDDSEGQFLFVNTAPAPVAKANGNGGQGRTSGRNRLSNYPHLRHYIERMRNIPAGTYRIGRGEELGTEWPFRDVRLSSFRLGETPVTVEVWREFCSVVSYPFPDPPEWGWLDGHPIVSVSWEDIMGVDGKGGYCAWASEVAGFRISLPTEAQWECGARGGQSGLKYPWGNDLDLSKCCWVGEDASDRRTAPVVRTTNIYRNPFGLTDMVGNVFQLCYDRLGSNGDERVTEVQTDPRGALSGRYRAMRGGSRICHPLLLLCAVRSKWESGARGEDIGFRLAADPS